MKKFLLYFAGCICTLLFLAYLAFLFYLPRAIDLNTYLPDLQELVKEQSNIDLDIKEPRVSTSPLLQAGIETGEITAKLPDGSTILDTDGIRVRISLPNLLLLTIKVSDVEMYNPKIYLDIVNDKLKVVSLIEDILNKKKNEPPKDTAPSKFDPAWIKIKVPSTKITNYTIIADDKNSGHKLTLRGDNLNLGYNNMKTARLKTYTELLSDDKTNITLKLNLDSFIPPSKEKDPDDDPAEKIEISVLNPVETYRNYDLKSDVDMNIRLRKDKNGKLNAKGYSNIQNITMNLSGLQLPYSNFRANFYGNSMELDTNLVVKTNQELSIKGKANFGENPFVNMNFFSDKIYFNDLIILSKAFLDTLQIKNNLAQLKAAGYIVGRGKFYTNLKKVQSEGSIIARDGYIANGRTNLVFDKINANLILDDNALKIIDTQTLVNGSILKVEGKVDADSYSDITIHSENLPLPGLFLAFAPSSVRRSISLNSGTISIDAKAQGTLKAPVAYANIILNNLGLRNDNFVINDEKLIAGIVGDTKCVDGSIVNKNFNFILPKTASRIQNQNISIKLTDDKISILPTTLLVNDNSKISIKGGIDKYARNSLINISADGFLNARDLRKFAGREAEPFIAAIGNLPLRAKISGTDKKQEIIVQLKSDESNYITPVDIDSMTGKQSILQAKIFNKKDGIQIRKTGFYTDVKSFTDDLDSNLNGAKTVLEISGTIMNNPKPFINVLKLDIPDELQGKISAFGHSRFRAGGNLLLFGKAESPIMRGNFKISNLNIPEILTSMNNLDLGLLNKDITLDIRRLLLNGSDVNIALRTDINPHPIFTISGLNVVSDTINVDTITKVIESLDKYLVKSESANTSSKSGIPVLLRNGTLRIHNLKTGNILLENTTGRLALQNSNLYLNNLDTSVFEGKVTGDIVVDLLDLIIGVKTQGDGLNVEKALLDASNTKDALTGTMKFVTDLTLDVKNPNDIMKNISGNIAFSIDEGQLGPFGKLENMILAENIRESQFFQTALGGVINSLATIDTSRFKRMDGLAVFDNGVVHILPITTIGNVMSLHIAGDFDLLKNTADMKVRAKLGAATANLLGPLAQLNPINLVQVTPGLNVVMAKTFFLFCESLTPEESAALPHLETELDDKLATKFQLVVRGDVSKPLTLIKSFKWLALASEIEAAKGFVDTLPDPSIVGDVENATVEEILKAQEEKAKEDAKLINRTKRFIKNLKHSDSE